MIAYLLETFEDAELLTNLCRKYRDDYHVTINVVYGDTTINGCSLLGIISLLGHTVTLQIASKMSGEAYIKFGEEARQISKCY